MDEDCLRMIAHNVYHTGHIISSIDEISSKCSPSCLLQELILYYHDCLYIRDHTVGVVVLGIVVSVFAIASYARRPAGANVPTFRIRVLTQSSPATTTRHVSDAHGLMWKQTYFGLLFLRGPAFPKPRVALHVENSLLETHDVICSLRSDFHRPLIAASPGR